MEEKPGNSLVLTNETCKEQVVNEPKEETHLRPGGKISIQRPNNSSTGECEWKCGTEFWIRSI